MALSDMMARGAAAESMMGAGPTGMPPVEPAMDEGMVPEEMGAPDIESALAGVEAALDGKDPAIAEEARSHVNAIRELCAQDVGPSTDELAPPEGAAPPVEPGPPLSEEEMPV